MSYRLTLFTNTGKPIDEIDASVHVAWAMNAPTNAEFTISALDAKCTEENLRFGNWVLFEHDKLPGWGGYIWTPRTWEPKIINVGMVSAEGMFDRRVFQVHGSNTGTAPGLFKETVDYGNGKGNMNIVRGQIGGDSSSITIELRGQTLMDAINEVQESSSHEWWCEPAKDNDGDLFFKANWGARRGKHVDYVLIEGINFIARRVSEEGGLYNSVKVIGEGTAGDSPVEQAHHQKSRSLYGLTQYAESMSSSSKASLMARANEIIQREAFPKMTFSGTVFGDDAFGKFSLGDDLTVQFDSMKFFGTGAGTGGNVPARVMAMEYRTEENALAVTFEQMIQTEDKNG